jgi:hypothetical protein
MHGTTTLILEASSELNNCDAVITYLLMTQFALSCGVPEYLRDIFLRPVLVGDGSDAGIESQVKRLGCGPKQLAHT